MFPIKWTVLIGSTLKLPNVHREPTQRVGIQIVITINPYSITLNGCALQHYYMHILSPTVSVIYHYLYINKYPEATSSTAMYRLAKLVDDPKRP